MLTDDVESLISEEKIVACNISDLLAITIEKEGSTQEYTFNTKKQEVLPSLRDNTTFLYQTDDNHYREYYSGITITAFSDNDILMLKEKKTKNNLLEEYQNKYKSTPIIISKNDLRKIGADEKIAFRKSQKDNKIFCELALNDTFKKAQNSLQQYCDDVILATEKDRYASEVFESLKGKEVYIIKIGDLQRIALNKKQSNEKFGYSFMINIEEFQTSVANHYTLLIKANHDSPILYEEYYSKRKILIEDFQHSKTILNPPNINKFHDYYNFILNGPLIAPKRPSYGYIPYTDENKHLIAENFGKDMEIKQGIEDISKYAATSLENDYKNAFGIDGSDYDDAFVDDALINIALKFKNSENKDTD